MACLKRNSALNIAFFTVTLLLGSTLRPILACSGLDSPVFLIHPQDTMVLEGGTAVLSCTIASFNPTTDSLTWQVQPDEYPTTISSSYNSLTEEETSAISVFHTGRINQEFQCIMHRLDRTFKFQACFSNIASMQVLYFPRDDEIDCGSTAQQDLCEGEVMSVWCRVKRGNPPVNLEFNNIAMNSSFRQAQYDEERDTFILRRNLHVTQALHNQVFTCTATSSEVFPNQGLLCVVGPFKVIHKPNVRIVSEEDTRIQTEKWGTYRLHLTCTGQGYPEVDSFLWSCFPPDLIEGCEGETDQTITVLRSANQNIEPKSEMRDLRQNVVVSCSATNAAGTSTARSVITVGRNGLVFGENMTYQNRSTRICENVSLQIEPPSETPPLNSSGYNFLFTCSLRCNGVIIREKRQFKWYIDNSEVRNHSSDILIDLSSQQQSVLMVRGRQRNNTENLITCKSTENDTIIETTIRYNISRPPGEVLSTMSTPSYDSWEVIQPTTKATVNYADTPSATSASSETPQNISIIHHGHDGLNTMEIVEDKYTMSMINVEFVKRLIIVAGVVPGILLGACVCAFLTTLLLRHFKRRDESGEGVESPALASVKGESGKDQNIESSDVSEEMYEEPIQQSFAIPPKTFVNYNTTTSAERFEVSSTSGTYSSATSSRYSNDSSCTCYGSYEKTNYESNDDLVHQYHTKEENGNGSELYHVNSDTIYNNDAVCKMHLHLRAVTLERSLKVEQLNTVDDVLYPPPPLPRKDKSPGNQNNTLTL